MTGTRLGEWLVSRSLITRSDLFQALNVAHRRGFRLGDALVEMGVVQRDRLERETDAMQRTLPQRRRAPTPPPLPAARGPRRQTPPPMPAEAFRATRRATPPPIPADVLRSAPAPRPAAGAIHLLTHRKDDDEQ